MLSPPDIAVIGALALIFFGPDQLPKVARKAGQVIREVQNTSQTFIREMERAADEMDLRDSGKPGPTMYGPRPASERLAEPSPAIAEQEIRTHADAAAANFVSAPKPTVTGEEDASGI